MPTFVAGPVAVSVPGHQRQPRPRLRRARPRPGPAATADGPGRRRPGVEIDGRGRGRRRGPARRAPPGRPGDGAAFDAWAAPPGLRLRCDNRSRTAAGLGRPRPRSWPASALARGLVTGGSLLMDDDAVLRARRRARGPPRQRRAGVVTAASRSPASTATGSGRCTLAVDPRVHGRRVRPADRCRDRARTRAAAGRVPHADAAANAGRAALLVAALTRQPELLLAATEDRLHQEYRDPAMPRDASPWSGRCGPTGCPAVVSGAGPTVLVLTDGRQQPTVARRAAGRDGATLVVPLDRSRRPGRPAGGGPPGLAPVPGAGVDGRGWRMTRTPPPGVRLPVRR